MSLVCSQLKYASSVWDLYHQGEIMTLRWSSIVHFVFRGYHREVSVVSSLLSKLNWSSLQECWKAACFTLLYKIVNKHVAYDLSHLLKTPVHNTRSNTSTDPAFINISTTKLPKTATNTLSFQYPTGIFSHHMFVQLALSTSSGNGYRIASQLFSTDTFLFFHVHHIPSWSLHVNVQIQIYFYM